MTERAESSTRGATATPAAAGVAPRAAPGSVPAGGAARSRRPRNPSAVTSERGSASVWLLTVGLVVVTVGVFSAAIGGAVVARHRAQAAADLGALSAAIHVLEGRDAACRRAARIVAANGGRLAGCRIEGLEAVVTAHVTAAGIAAGLGPARAHARAGPVTSGNPP